MFSVPMISEEQEAETAPVSKKQHGPRKKLVFSPREDTSLTTDSISVPSVLVDDQQDSRRKKQLLLMKRTRSGPMTPLEKLEHAYAEKEEEAILAAQIGQKLLQKVVEDEKIIQELKIENEGKTSEITALYRDLDKLDTQIAQIKNESKGEQKVEDLERKCQQIETLCSLLRKSIEETERVNRNLLAQIAERENEVKSLSELAKENEKFRIKYLELSEEIEKMKEEHLRNEESLKTKMQIEIAQKSREIDELRSRLRESNNNSPKKAVAMTSSGPMAVSSDSAISSAQQLSLLRKEKSDLAHQLDTAKVEYQKLSEAIAILVKENESLHKDRDESNMLLDEHRDIVTAMRTQIEELKLLLSHQQQSRRSSTPSLPPDPSAELGNNLAEELLSASRGVAAQQPGVSTGDALTQQMDLIEDLKRSVGRSSSVSSVPLVASSSSRSIPISGQQGQTPTTTGQSAEFQNIREYFFLAAAAMKVHIATRNPDYSHIVFQIDVNDCYHLAMREKVPFHEWHSWLLSTFLNIFNEKHELHKKEEKERAEREKQRTVPQTPDAEQQKLLAQRTTRSATAPPTPSFASSTPTKSALSTSGSSASSPIPANDWKCGCGIVSKRTFCPKCNARPK